MDLIIANNLRHRVLAILARPGKGLGGPGLEAEDRSGPFRRPVQRHVPRQRLAGEFGTRDRDHLPAHLVRGRAEVGLQRRLRRFFEKGFEILFLK